MNGQGMLKRPGRACGQLLGVRGSANKPLCFGHGIQIHAWTDSSMLQVKASLATALGMADCYTTVYCYI